MGCLLLGFYCERDMCSNSGHAETVKVEYDESQISLEKLLEYYFLVIDPGAVNRQGSWSPVGTVQDRPSRQARHDIGIQYRTGIYFTEDDQLPVIQEVYDRLEKEAGIKFAVEVKPLDNYFTAEEYHQKYLDKNPGGYCHIPGQFFHVQDAEKEKTMEMER